MKYNSRNSARLKTNKNIFQLFDEYISYTRFKISIRHLTPALLVPNLILVFEMGDDFRLSGQGPDEPSAVRGGDSLGGTDPNVGLRSKYKNCKVYLIIVHRNIIVRAQYLKLQNICMH